MEFSENTRVKIPALVHATRLGYKYLSLKEYKNEIDVETNIFKNIFKESINKINNLELSDDNITKLINELSFSLANDDLGRQFYKYLINGYKGIKLIDFEDEKNNEYNVVTELTYKNGEDEFRPDVIRLINGMPVGFLEVKKPNNRGHISRKK